MFVVIVITLTIFLAKTVNRLLKVEFEIASQKMDVDETVYRLVRRMAVAVVYLVGIMIIISRVPFLKDISLALFAGAGFAGIIIGLAAQSTLSNIFSGISLAAFRPFRVGDLVNIHDEYGTISDITLRHTVVTTWDNRKLIIPNHIINDEAVINWSIEDPTILWPIDIGISYDSDIDLARSIMLDEAKNHVNVMKLDDVRSSHSDIVGGKEIRVFVTELGDFAVNMRLTFWVRDRSLAYFTGCDLRESIKKRFDAEGIEIPFPYRTIVYKKDIMGT
ncbi:MAG: mechanosensitive ion channel [Methanosarcinaceae archaeon]|nr:mechanosensitive ion channel [Methanosarcinaceae archaeon]